MDEAAEPLPPTAAPASEPRGLSADERDAWMALAGMLIRLPATLDAQLQRDAGISTFEYLVLSALSEAPERTRRMSDLATFTNGSLSRLSHVVTRLERRGWVRREPCPEDGRYTHAILTQAGWDKVVATAPGHVRAVRHLVLDALTTTQVRQLHEIGRRVLRRIDPDEPCLNEQPRRAARRREEPRTPGRRTVKVDDET